MSNQKINVIRTSQGLGEPSESFHKSSKWVNLCNHLIDVPQVGEIH